MNQEEHHKKTTFREEYMELLQELQISYKEEYVFTFFGEMGDFDWYRGALHLPVNYCVCAINVVGTPYPKWFIIVYNLLDEFSNSS